MWIAAKGPRIVFERAGEKIVKIAVGIGRTLGFAHIHAVALYKIANIAARKGSLLPPSAEGRREWIMG